ncbi:MAG TPA: rhodanese-like domain-containing protein [Propionibacteriaceae bacterium]|nr:rhodanese-like domain-containing protein [Propionibacteriaceae bacterium]
MELINDIPQIPVNDLPYDAVLLDVREPNEYAAGHAPGAVSVPMGELRARILDIPPRGEDALLVVCRSGARSQKVAEYLASLDIPAINVIGGTTAWAQSGRPLVSETGDEPAVVAPTTPPPAAV